MLYFIYKIDLSLTILTNKHYFFPVLQLIFLIKNSFMCTCIYVFISFFILMLVIMIIFIIIILLLIIIFLYLADDLNPVLDLNMTVVNPQMTLIYRVAPLPDGGAFVYDCVRSNDTHQVWMVNVTGQVIQHVYKCVRCNYAGLQGLLVLNSNLYVIYGNGKLIQININNTSTVQVYQVPDVWGVYNWGSLSHHPSVITHPDLLLLADRVKGEIFSYNVTSKNKQVHLTDLWYPTSVSFMTYNSHLYYVISEYKNHQVRIYNSSWSLYKTLGGTEGSGDGQLDRPTSAIGLPDGSVIIIDTGNNRVCLFTIHGKFVRHILTRSDRIYRPRAMSVSLPYLWVDDTPSLYRYKLY